MAIRRGIAELFEAIPDRIEVAGQAPTWRVTGGSFEAVVAYVDEAIEEDVVVVAREDRTRWWPRVTLTVTTDPELAAAAPPLASFTDPVPVDETDEDTDDEAGDGSEVEPEPVDPLVFDSFLDDVFFRQEEARMARGLIPEQRQHG